MFMIDGVDTERVTARFAGHGKWRSNKVDIITGPNGSGKTELLTAIAAAFRRTGKVPVGVSVSWSKDGRGHTRNRQDVYADMTGPVRVITQTFSPFSRFAAPADDLLTLTDIYAKGEERDEIYRSIGLHRRSRYIGGVLSRHTLEQGLFRLSESPEQTKPMADVLRSLGFKDSVRIVYREAFSWAAAPQRDLVKEINDYLASFDEKRRPIPTGIARELTKTSRIELVDLMAQALDLVSSRRKARDLDFVFNFSYSRASEDFAVLQAIALLRRLRVLALRSCELTLESGTTIDLASASSGQQQMLCSIFGLVAELRSDSLVLIDEPELSLHPNWQMSFLDRLKVVMSQFEGCHVLIATHSPIIVQKALQSGLDVTMLGDQSVAFEGGDIHIGAGNSVPISVEGTLLDVFATPITGSVYVANEIFNVVTSAESGDDTARQGAISRLNTMRERYARSDSPDRPTLSLIDDAIKLVSEPEVDEGAQDA